MYEGREHMPWLQVDQGPEEVETVGCSERDDDLPEGLVLSDESVKGLALKF